MLILDVEVKSGAYSCPAKRKFQAIVLVAVEMRRDKTWNPRFLSFVVRVMFFFSKVSFQVVSQSEESDDGVLCRITTRREGTVVD